MRLCQVSSKVIIELLLESYFDFTHIIIILTLSYL